jgi:hypothetical protein
MKIHGDQLPGPMVNAQVQVGRMDKNPHEQMGFLQQQLGINELNPAMADGYAVLKLLFRGDGNRKPEGLINMFEEQINRIGYGLKMVIEITHKEFNP